MTKARIREIRYASQQNSAHASIIAELLAVVIELQSRTRRGEDLSAPVEELPLAANVNAKKKARGTQLEMESFAAELKLQLSDGEFFFHKMEATDWKVGGKPIKCWKSQMRSWNVAKWFPSQKSNGSHSGAPVAFQEARCNL